MRPIEQVKPTIRVVCSTEFGREETLQQLCYGIEEEGIPYEVLRDQTGSAMVLAVQGSNQSRLDVGIGLDGEEVVLHYTKLRVDQGLFEIPVRSTETALRALGANGARLVKKLPFKALQPSE